MRLIAAGGRGPWSGGLGAGSLAGMDDTTATLDGGLDEITAAADAGGSSETLLEDELLVEEISIDGMCGVY